MTDVLISIGQQQQHQMARTTLTPREQQIVRLIADGCSNAEIAERLKVRVQTVKNRLCEIYQKTGARNRVGLALLTIRDMPEKNDS